MTNGREPRGRHGALAACFALSLTFHLALLVALHGTGPRLHVLQPAPILVTLYDVGMSAAGPGPVAPELGVDPASSPFPSKDPPAAKPAQRQPTPARLARPPAARPDLQTRAKIARPPNRAAGSAPPTPASVHETAKPKAEPSEEQNAKLADELRAGENEEAASASAAPASGEGAHDAGKIAAAAIPSTPGGGAERVGPLGGSPGGTGAGAPEYAATIRIAYEQQIYLWLERFKLYPQLAQRRRLEGTSTLRVRIDRKGRVLASALERPTGEHLLDDAALEMVRRAEPFPPIPAGYPDDTFEFLAPVQFRLR